MRIFGSKGVYDQSIGGKSSDICTILAIAGSIENLLRKSIPQKEAEEFYERNETDDRPGIRYTDILKALEARDPLGGQHIVNWELLFNQDAAPYRNKSNLIHDIHYATKVPRTGIIVGFKLQKERPAIELTKENWYVPAKDHDGSFHMMFIKELIFDKYEELEGFWIQNSYGRKFGVNGAFRIKLSDFLKDVRLVLTFKI